MRLAIILEFLLELVQLFSEWYSQHKITSKLDQALTQYEQLETPTLITPHYYELPNPKSRYLPLMGLSLNTPPVTNTTDDQPQRGKEPTHQPNGAGLPVDG